MKNKMLKRSHLSEKICREIIQLFSDDLTATQIAAITNVSRVTINSYLKLIRTHIAAHCETQAGAGGRFDAAAGLYSKAVSHMYYGCYGSNGLVFTQKLQYLDKTAIRTLQQEGMLKGSGILPAGHVMPYQAIADFDEWRLYQVDACAQDDIMVFWGNTRHRLLKFRGMNKKTLYLHVKESEFRFNYRGEDLNRVLLNIIYRHPLHFSRACLS